MLNNQDRDAINGLFDRLDEAARRSPPRDPDAETLIQQRLRQSPPSPYYMAQTILVQEQALEGARQQIEALEAQLASRSSNSGFLGGLFGNGPTHGQSQRPQRGPWDRGNDYGYGRGGGSFLGNAAQTALGVTGGVLLGSAIAGLFTGGANASEFDAGQPSDNASDAGTDPGSDGFGGDSGDFDIGGDF